MSSISNLNNLASIARLWRGKPAGKKSFKFNWTNGYIQQVWYSWGVVRKQNDWSRDYWQCYWGYFNIGDSAVHGLDNRSVQTQKHVFYMDDLINWVNLSWYAWLLSVKINTSWQIEVETQWTWSARVTTVWTFTAWSIVNIIVRVNNTLPSWTARVIWDVDVFIWGSKDTKSFASLWNNTTTSSVLTRWAYNTTTNLFRWRLYNFSLWNRALSDAECQAEWLSNRSVVTPSWLVNTWDTTDTSQAISRTWYNLNWSGNYSVATDADGKYILLDGNRDATAATWTVSNFTVSTNLVFTEKTSFTKKIRVKILSVPSNNNSWLLWTSFTDAINIDNVSWWRLKCWFRSGGTTNESTFIFTIWTLYDVYVRYDAVTQKFTFNIWNTIINTWWTSIPWTFSTWAYLLWDNAVNSWNATSCKKQIYHARIWSRFLSDAEIAADIALGNNTNNDPTIVASYRPDNLINWQGVASPNDLTWWLKTWWTTVTANTTVAPDWTTTADTVAISWTATQWVENFTADLTGSSLASKTFIVKAFVKVASWTAQFRIKNTHRLVADYFSSDLTATTTWQEFTFSATFTSATNWTWVTYWIINDTWATNPTLQVRNVRLFLVNEILYDNSPNIGWYVWPLTNRYISWWIKPWVDAPDDASGNPIINLWYWFSYIRTSSNFIRIRYDNRIWAIERFTALWTWFRWWVHFTWWIERDWTAFYTIVYLNWVLIWRWSISYLDAWILVNPNQANVWLWRNSSRYFTWSMRDSRFFTSPTALTDAQALMITNWGDPAWVTKVLHRDVVSSDTTNYVTDKSGNGRVGYITWGVTKTF